MVEGWKRSFVSKASIKSKNSIVPLSRDHRPDDPQESKRIEADGGRVERSKRKKKVGVGCCLSEHS